MTTDLKINSYPKHIGDWRSGTARMSLAEEGAYTRLCDQYYLDGGDGWTIEECLRICRAISRDEQRAVKAVLASKFEKTDTGFSHAGMDERIAAIEAASEKNQERARAAADARWQASKRRKQCQDDAQSNATSMPQALLEQFHPKAKSQKPVIEGSRLSNESLSPSTDESEINRFVEFAKAYPKELRGKAPGLAWIEATQHSSSQEILEGLARQKAVWLAEGRSGRFIPDADKWLSDEGWRVISAAPSSEDSAFVWEGPQDLMDAIIDALGRSAAQSCFLGSKWDGLRIVPTTKWVSDKLAEVPGLEDIVAPISRRVA